MNEFPQVFLNYLDDNKIPLEIYSKSLPLNRFICVCPTKYNISTTELSKDFPGGVEECEEYSGFYRLTHPFPANAIIKSSLYKSAHIIAMDLSSGMAIKYLGVDEDDHVLDLCCAPGTKLTLAGLLTGPNGSVTGVDIARHRLSIARSMVKKYKVPNVRLFNCDGVTFDRRVFLPKINGNDSEPHCFYSSSVYRRYKGIYDSHHLYDKVLVDTQCTHDGSIKHVRKCQENGWSSSDLEQYEPESLESLYRLQFDLLKNGFRLLKAGGILVYSTCSLSNKQNEEIVLRLLREDLSAEPATEPDGHYMRSFNPITSKTGGFFIARLTKTQISNGVPQ